jgi:hypothetical protein
VEWRFGWEAKLCESRDSERWVSWINKSWECRGCCHDSMRWMMELGDVRDRRRLRRLNTNGPDKARRYSSNAVNLCASEQDQDQDRPMLIRRECLRHIRPRYKNPYYISFCGYRELAFECLSWAGMSPAKETTEDRHWYGDICSQYSSVALQGGGDVAKGWMTKTTWHLQIKSCTYICKLQVQVATASTNCALE